MTWQFLNTGFRDGEFNMACDEFLARLLIEGRGRPTLRVYGWQPNAISLGFHQNAGDIDHDLCRADGIDLVRRPTGGRAIFHAHEVTYSVVMHLEGRGAMEVYAHISRALVLSLRHLGCDADVAPATVDFPVLYKSRAGVACFAAASRCEIRVEGKKIVGSAQRRYETSGPRGGGVVLQHGSILLGPQHRRLVRYVSDRRPHESVRAALEQRTMEAETILRRTVSFEEAAEAVRSGFQDAWGVAFVGADEPTIEGRPGKPHEMPATIPGSTP